MAGIDPQQFKEAQRKSWDSVAPGWQECWKTFENGAQTVSDHLVELAKINPNSRVLDIATGIGEPAITAAKKIRIGNGRGYVLATDMSTQMLSIAKQRASSLDLQQVIEFMDGDTETISLPASTFDAVLCRWGLMFLPDLRTRLSNIYRSMVEGGRLAAAVWASPEEVPFISVVINIVSEQTHKPLLPIRGIPGPFSLADENVLKDALVKARFKDIVTDSNVTENKINLYELLDGFISYLQTYNAMLAPSSIQLYIASVRSYFAYNDIDVIPSKFKRKVKIPKLYREDEEPLDASDIRKILLACNNRRLKTHLIILASGGMRAVEGLAIRIMDVDFSVNPTKIHIRKEYTARDIYISNEATNYIRQWLDWKYNNPQRSRQRDANDLVFTIYKNKNPDTLYVKVLTEFQKLLEIVGLNQRKEGGKQRRRKITLHSFRRFTKSVISDQVSQDFSEWFLGHSKSPYYTKKESERREIYATKCMKYLTFLDYTTLEAAGKNIEANLRQKDSEIAGLKEKYEQDMKVMREEMNQQFNQIMSMIQDNPKLAQIKPEILRTKKNHIGTGLYD